MDLLSIAIGAAGVGGLYFLYLAATKGVPAATAAAKGWWTAGKAELATIKNDLAEVEKRLTVEVDAIKARLTVAGIPAAPSPALPGSVLQAQAAAVTAVQAALSAGA